MNNKRTLLFMAYTTLFVWIVPCFLDFGEQPRFMFLVYPFLLILGTVGITALARKMHRAKTNKEIKYYWQTLPFGRARFYKNNDPEAPADGMHLIMVPKFKRRGKKK